MTPEQRIEEIDWESAILGDNIRILNAQQIKASDAADHHRDQAEYYRDQKGGLIQQRDALIAERRALLDKIASEAAAASARRKSRRRALAWAVAGFVVLFLPFAMVSP